MLIRTFTKPATWLTGLLCFSAFTSAVNAATTLSNVPLFLSNRAEANIFFMVDDSGSMDLEMLTTERNGDWGGVYTDGGGNIFRYVFGANPGTGNQFGGVAPLTQTYLRSHAWNKMYYDPAQSYTPWANHYNIGESPTSTSATSVPIRPDASVSRTALGAATQTRVDLTSTTWSIGGFNYSPAQYYVWVDDGDGVVERTDTYFQIVITAATPVCASGVNATVAQQTASGGCMLRPYADEIKNFANWFTYHRRREFAAIHALSHTINNSPQVRMGMATINDDVTAERQMASMNADGTTGNKLTLLNTLFNVDPNGSTPLRTALRNVGNYFACSGGTPFGGGACAVQTAAISPATTPPGACQQNFAVLVSDGEYNDGAIGTNNDNDNTSYTGTYYPNGTGVVENFQFDVEPYRSATNQTIADIAMDYYERDLHGTLENRVPIQCGIDENPGQHMVTYALSFGIPASITPPSHPRRGYANNCTASTGTAFTWNDTAPIDDLVHATFNGRGQYVDADSPEALSTGLTDVIRNIASRNGASSAVTFNSSVLSGTTRVYFSRFNSGFWNGQLSAYPLTATGAIGATPDWEVQTNIDASGVTYDNRTIITYNPGLSTTSVTIRAGIPFRWDLTKFSTTQRDDLRTDSTGTQEATAGYPVAQARLNFIRGARDCESSSSLTTCTVSKQFRDRDSRLGDLVHSAPVYVGVPFDKYPENAPFGISGAYYSNYKNGELSASGTFNSPSTYNAKTRTPVIYIGGNDGMLHAFNASNTTGQPYGQNGGDEIWAYIPHAVYATTSSDGIHELTEPSYAHRFYVDLTPTIVDVYANIKGVTNWHTVLVGGLRRGGQAIFAIDVTDPDHIINEPASTRETVAANKVLWEFTNSSDSDLGYTYSQPSIVMLEDSNWYVVFGNGYDSTSTGGKSVLFLLKITGPGSDGVWDLNTDYYKISTEVGSATTRNGLSTPVLVDNNGDGFADRAYAGDLYGRLWAFDLSGTNPGNWAVAYKTGATPNPLFTATDNLGVNQPITTKPAVIRHPTIPLVSSGAGVNKPDIMVYFGTGRYLFDTDQSTTGLQTFYGVWDKGTKNLVVNRSTPSSSNLVQQTFIGGTPADIRVTDNSKTVDYTSKYGWFMDLNESGERVAFNPQVRSGIVFFNTLIPSVEPCVAGGSGWIMAVTADQGHSYTQPIIDANRDGVFNGSDLFSGISAAGVKLGTTTIPTDFSLLGGGGGGGGGGCPSGTKPNYQYITMSDGSITQRQVCLQDGTKTGRFSWRQLGF